jgi:hypothetical protein
MVMEMRRLQIVSAVWSRPTHEASEGQIPIPPAEDGHTRHTCLLLIRRCVAGEVNLVVVWI